MWMRCPAPARPAVLRLRAGSLNTLSLRRPRRTSARPGSRRPQRLQVQLNKQLMQCQKPVDVLSVLQNARCVPNSVNIATALVQLARIPELTVASSSGPAAKTRQSAGLDLCNSAAAALSGCTGRELANIGWAVAKLGGDQGNLAPAARWLLAELGTEVLGRPTGLLTPHGVSQLAWAYGRAGPAAQTTPLIFARLATELQKQLAVTSSHALANTAWGFAAAGFRLPAPLLAGLYAEVHRRGLQQFTTQGTGNLAWALGTTADLLKINERNGLVKAFFESVGSQSKLQLSFFSDQELCNVVWAAARCGLSGPEAEKTFYTPVVADFQHRLDLQRRLGSSKETARKLSIVAWALTAADCAGPAARRLESCIFFEFDTDEQLQLVLLEPDVPAKRSYEREQMARQLGIAMMVTSNRAGLPASDRAVRLRLLRKISNKFKKTLDGLPQDANASSRFHMAVSKALLRLGICHTNEMPVAGGVFHIDIVLRIDKLEGQPDKELSTMLEMMKSCKCVGFEVDGPTHFLPAHDGVLHPNTTTLLKRRALNAQGWLLESISYTEWTACAGQYGAEEHLLRLKMQQLTNQIETA